MTADIPDAQSFVSGFHFGLAIVKLQIPSVDASALLESLEAIAKGELSLRQSPLDVIAEMERKTGPLPEAKKKMLHDLFSNRNTSDERIYARAILNSLKGIA